MIHSEERIMVWGGYNNFFPPPRLSSQLMRLRTHSKNLFFPSGLFLMYSIYSVVCLVLPLWSLIPNYLEVVGWLEPVWALRVWMQLREQWGTGCPGPFPLGKVDLGTWQGHCCPHLIADLSLTPRWGGFVGSCVLCGNGGVSSSPGSFFSPVWMRSGCPGLNQCLHPSGEAVPREMCKAPGTLSS